MEFEKHGLERIPGRKQNTSPKLIQGIFAYSTASYTMLTVTLCRSECCVQSGLDFEATGDSVVSYFVSNYGSKQGFEGFESL